MLIKDYNAPIIPGGSFRWREYAYLPGFGNLAVPNEQEFKNAVFLFSQLQPLRAKLNKPLVITSGARTLAYTMHLRKRGIPAALFSAHRSWQAVDLVCPGMETRKLWEFLCQHWDGRIEAWEATQGDPRNGRDGWVHIDTRNWGKRDKALIFKP